MSRSGYRRLALGCLIAGLSTWYGLSHLLAGAGPAGALAATSEPSDVDELLDLPPTRVSAAWEAVLREQRERAQAEWPANPFFRLVATAAEDDEEDDAQVLLAEPRFVLSAVIGGTRPLAVINGLVVTIGDRLADGSTITAIGGYSVRLHGPEGTRTLRLSE